MNGAKRSAEAVGCKNASVGERSTLGGSTRVSGSRRSGSENVGLSNANIGENPMPQKPKGSSARFVHEGLSFGVEGIARIEIQKRLDLIQVIIYMGFPKLLIEDKPRKLEELQMNVQKELNCMNRKLNIAITRIGNPYGHPNILAEFIAGQLKNRVSFRKAMKKAIELIEQADTKGIQIQIARRIDGKEIARVEWIREGLGFKKNGRTTV
ncbi:hypothetical protein PVK06_005385 [Gossypium arboreum]|uniref:Small ribosomal subunit protein uS3c n=1 Tax=Gossypium arboreum TaxID=29729 RepID=A0ABR0QVG6_GOSAR|nr:hypothetical protein PVK06_005385 [Gossypium arboreum]